MKTKDYLEWASENLDSRIKNSNFKKELREYYGSLITDIELLKEQLVSLHTRIDAQRKRFKN